MEEPQIIEEPAAKVPESRGKSGTKKSAQKKKSKLGGVAFSYLIALILFGVGIAITFIDGLDLSIEQAFMATSSPFHSFGNFFDPFPLLLFQFSAFSSGQIGMMFAEIYLYVAAVLIIVGGIPLAMEKSKAKKENRKVIEPASTKYFKYGVLAGISYLIGFGVTVLALFLKHEAAGPWYSPDSAGISLISTHVGVATLTAALAMSFVGSSKKILALIIGIASAFYVFCVGVSRMAMGVHLFSDVLFSGFICYSAVLFVYFAILDIPGQEMIYRHKLTVGPFNEGYKLIIDGKAMLADNADEGIKKISDGLAILAKARENAEQVTKNGHDCSVLIARINDLVGRIGILLQEHPIDIEKWSYMC